SAGRVLSGNADGLHFQDCTGTLTIRNCDIKSNGDDCVNITSDFLRVDVIGSGSNPFVLCRPGPSYFSASWSHDDVVQFFTEDLARRALGGAAVKVNTFAPIDPLTPLGPFNVTFQTSPTGIAVGDYIADVSKGPSSALIQSCTFENNIARGVVLHGHDI